MWVGANVSEYHSEALSLKLRAEQGRPCSFVSSHQLDMSSSGHPGPSSAKSILYDNLSVQKGKNEEWIPMLIEGPERDDRIDDASETGGSCSGGIRWNHIKVASFYGRPNREPVLTLLSSSRSHSFTTPPNDTRAPVPGPNARHGPTARRFVSLFLQVYIEITLISS